MADNKRPYVINPVNSRNYEFQEKVLTFNKHPHGKYMEVKLTSNDLSGYPNFDDPHFSDTKNLLGWSIVTDRRVNISPTNPKGERAYVIEEIQNTGKKNITTSFFFFLLFIIKMNSTNNYFIYKYNNNNRQLKKKKEKKKKDEIK